MTRLGVKGIRNLKKGRNVILQITWKDGSFLKAIARVVRGCHDHLVKIRLSKIAQQFGHEAEIFLKALKDRTYLACGHELYRP